MNPEDLLNELNGLYPPPTRTPAEGIAAMTFLKKHLRKELRRWLTIWSQTGAEEDFGVVIDLKKTMQHAEERLRNYEMLARTTNN